MKKLLLSMMLTFCCFSGIAKDIITFWVPKEVDYTCIFYATTKDEPLFIFKGTFTSTEKAVKSATEVYNNLDFVNVPTLVHIFCEEDTK